MCVYHAILTFLSCIKFIWFVKSLFFFFCSLELFFRKIYSHFRISTKDLSHIFCSHTTYTMQNSVKREGTSAKEREGVRRNMPFFLRCRLPFREKCRCVSLPLQIPFEDPCLTISLGYCHISMHEALKKRDAGSASYSCLVQN